MVIVQVIDDIDFAFLSSDKFSKFINFLFQMLVSNHKMFDQFIHYAGAGNRVIGQIDVFFEFIFSFIDKLATYHMFVVLFFKFEPSFAKLTSVHYIRIV